jgi:hypothetical protein
MQAMRRKIFLLGSLAMLPAALPALAQTPGQGGEAAAARPQPPEAFRTPEAGFAAFLAAARAHDEPRLLRILGGAGKRLIQSGDRVADRDARDRLAAAYAAKHEILRPAPDRAVLQVGDDDWPLPIPMVQRGGAWRFDAAAGSQEIIDRRIGRNELDTIETLRAIADAQDDYAQTAGRQGAFRAYARRFFSSPGQRDGLYWPTRQGEAESPLGPLVAAASAGGYSRQQQGEAPQAYHGYLFRILEGQGAAAPGGAMNYVVNGRMIGGFGVLATPAQYGSTGIKSFMINHEGTVWEQDLGPDTMRVAARIRVFDPGPGWTRVAE